MALKDILVCLDPTDAGERRLRLATPMARQHQAHLSAAYIMAEAIPGAPPYEGIGVAAPAGASEIAQGSIVAGVPVPGAPPIVPSGASRATELADIVEQRFRQGIGAQPGDDIWHLFGPGDSEELIALSRSFDLVIYGQASADYRLPTGFGPEDIVIASGRPLLVVPYAGEIAAVGNRALIAWDGTREAARALHDALPLIAEAEAVTAITVSADPAGGEEIEMSLDRVVRHLHRHGIAAKREETPRADIRTADVLLSRASDIEADLIVAGAYHHSQLREAIVGGVSRELLDHMTVPVLMSH
jgi:nucleotide-binding universal stress UspA family protein